MNKPQSRPAIWLLIKYVLKQLSEAETDECDDAWALCAFTGVKKRSRNLSICEKFSVSFWLIIAMPDHGQEAQA